MDYTYKSNTRSNGSCYSKQICCGGYFINNIRHILDNTPYIVFLMVFTFGAMWPLEKIQEIREELKDKLKELRSKEVDRNR